MHRKHQRSLRRRAPLHSPRLHRSSLERSRSPPLLDENQNVTTTVESASGNQKRAAKPRQVVRWHVLQETEELVRKLECMYLLCTNVAGTDAGQVWEDYVTLIRVENAFRTLKHDLALRPV